MIYLLAIFCSPLALLLIGKPFQALANAILYLLSLVFWVTIIFHAIGFMLWAIGVLHAILSINSHEADKRTDETIAALNDSQEFEPQFENRKSPSPGNFSPS